MSMVRRTHHGKSKHALYHTVRFRSAISGARCGSPGLFFRPLGKLNLPVQASSQFFQVPSQPDHMPFQDLGNDRDSRGITTSDAFDKDQRRSRFLRRDTDACRLCCLLTFPIELTRRVRPTSSTMATVTSKDKFAYLSSPVLVCLVC